MTTDEELLRAIRGNADINAFQDPVGAAETGFQKKQQFESSDFTSVSDKELLNLIKGYKDTQATERVITEPMVLDNTQILNKRLQETGVSGNVSEGDFSDFGARIDLGLSREFTEKRKKFLDKYPMGDMVQVDAPGYPEGTKKSILLKRYEDEDYIPLDSNELNFLDVADFVPEIPNVALSVLLTGKGKIASEVLKQVGAEGAVEGLKESVEALRGYQDESINKLAKEIALSAGTAGVFGALNTRGAKKSEANIGETVFGGKADLARVRINNALKANEKNIRLPILTVDQVSDSNVLRLMGRQARALNPKMKRYEAAQNKAVIYAVSNLREPELAKFVRGDLDTLNKEMFEDVTSIYKALQSDYVSAGESFKELAASYAEISEAAVTRAYAQAKNKGDITYDVSPLKSIMESPEFKIMAPTRKRILQEESLEDFQEKIIDGGEELNLQNVQSSVMSVLNDIDRIDWSKPKIEIGGNVYTQTDWIRNIRQRLFNIKSMPLEGATPEQRQAIQQARRVYGEITKVMRNPLSESADVAAAYKKADTLAAKRFENLEYSFMMDALYTKEPTSFVSKFLTSGNYDRIKFIDDLVKETSEFTKKVGTKDTISPRWQEIKDGFVGEALKYNPEKISSLPEVLKGYPQRELDLLIPREEQAKLFEVAEGIEQIRLLDLAGIRKSQENDKLIVQEIIRNGNTAATKRLGDLIKSNKDAPQSRNIRGATIDYLIGTSVGQTKDGTKFLSADKLKKSLRELNEGGLLPLLTRDDVVFLKSAADYAQVVNSRLTDAGTSLQAASAVSDIRELFSPAKGEISGFITYLETFGTSWAFTSPQVRKFLVKPPKTGKEILREKQKNAFLGQIIVDFARDHQFEQEQE